MMQMINLISLDYAIAIKQLVANKKHSINEHYNHCNRFYAVLLGVSKEDNIVPFLDKK